MGLNCSKFFATSRTLTPGHDPVQKVTLIPRGQARGLTWFIPGEDPALISKQQLFARIIGGLGGRAAEEVIFGESEITTGAAGDLQQITQIARQVYIYVVTKKEIVLGMHLISKPYVCVRNLNMLIKEVTRGIISLLSIHSRPHNFV